MKRSRSDLHDAIAHVRYTIDQLLSVLSWSLLEKKMPLDEIQKAIFKNACIESSLVSLRILNEFFKPERTQDRITASSYPGYNTAGPFLSKPDLQRVNDHLAHLTWKRLEDPSPIWQDSMFDSALGACRDFLRFISTSFVTTQDREYAPLSQELAAIEAYLKLKKR